MSQQRPSITVNYSKILLSNLLNKTRDQQKEIMRVWFLENYEDPVMHTPYDSHEGGYIYMLGGPYDAHEELSFFGGYVPDEVIDELGDELSAECPEWAGIKEPNEYEEEYFNIILSDNKFFESFNDSINHVRAIILIEAARATKEHLLGLLYVSVITILETYLSDAFINTVVNDETRLRIFIERNPEFNKRTFKLSEIYVKYEGIKEEIKNYLLSQLWHNLGKVKPMYKSTLDVDFPADLDLIFKAIKIRHDLVHRNGKNKDGEQIIITQEQLEELIEQTVQFVQHIDAQLNKFDHEEDLK